MNIPQNVNWIVKNGLCIGCGVCAAVCPSKAIKMSCTHGAGMIFPIIDGPSCIGCGICLDVCYGFKVDPELNLRIFKSLPKSILGNYIRSYTGFAKNPSIRLNSTSGGVVTALLMYALEVKLIDGVIVIIMESGNPPRAKAIIATTTEEILSSVGSKYCPVSLAECLEAIENDKRYAVVGLPCHIYGVRKLVACSPKLRNSICLYLGILCGGMPSYLGTQYLLRVYGVEKQYVKRLEYRGGGWPGRLLIQSEFMGQQKKISVAYPDYWQGAFRYFHLYRCMVCHDGFNEFSDISCGDAWLPRIMRDDKKGTSLIITRTENGERLVQDALQKGYIQISAIKSQDVIKSQQGLIQFKNLTLKSRMNLFKIFRKKLPIFDLSRTPAANFMSYLVAIDLYLGSEMASKRNSWWLLDIYVSLGRTMERIIRRLKRHET